MLHQSSMFCKDKVVPLKYTKIDWYSRWLGKLQDMGNRWCLHGAIDVGQLGILPINVLYQNVPIIVSNVVGGVSH